mgnify:CR=1 FL=1
MSSDRKKLRWLMNEHDGQSINITITPGIAQQMLEFNADNRPVSNTTVRRYAEQMRDGKWLWIPHPICFTSEPKLIDGQHRLKACLEAGTAFDASVYFGAPPDIFSLIDTGRTRTAYDIFSINGVKNANQVAGAVRWVLAYDDGYMKLANFRNQKITPQDQYDAYRSHEALQLSCPYGGRMNDARLGSATMFTALHYICARISRSEANNFFEHLADGLFSSKDCPMYQLERILRENQTRRADDRRSYRVLFAYTIKGWNAYRAGRPLKQFKLGADEAFPKAY